MDQLVTWFALAGTFLSATLLPAVILFVVGVLVIRLVMNFPG